METEERYESFKNIFLVSVPAIALNGELPSVFSSAVQCMSLCLAFGLQTGRAVQWLLARSTWTGAA